jgi:hypothetical protein
MMMRQRLSWKNTEFEKGVIMKKVIFLIIVFSLPVMAADRASFGNLATQMSFGQGEPFKSGDIISVPAYMLVQVSAQKENGKIVYLVSIVSDSGNGKAIILVSSRKLSTIGNKISESVTIKYLSDQGDVVGVFKVL